MVKRNHFIEVGRVVEINYGTDAGKLAVIVDIVDQARALIDGPASITGVHRQTIPYRNLSLTHITLPIAKSVKTKTLETAWKAADVTAQWNKTSWARKAVVKATRAALTDFERFTVVVLKKKRNGLIAREVGKLKRASSKAAPKKTKA